MTIRTRMTALAFASLLAAAAAPFAANAADNTPLPGQPGADTSLGQELRGAPYTVMMVTSSGAMSQRSISVATATELMKHAKPMSGMVVLMHDGNAYAIEDMKMSDGRMLYDDLDLPGNLLP